MNIERLKNDVAAQTTITQSAVTLLSGLQSHVQQIADDTTDDDTASELSSLADQIEANTQALASAIGQNTSASGVDPSETSSASSGQPDTQEQVVIGEGGAPITSPSVDPSEAQPSADTGGSSGDDSTQQGGAE